MGSGRTHPKTVESRAKWREEHLEREKALANWPANLRKIQACTTWAALVELLGGDGETGWSVVFYLLEREIEDCHRRATIERGRDCPNHEAAAKADAHIAQLALNYLRSAC